MKTLYVLPLVLAFTAACQSTSSHPDMSSDIQTLEQKKKEIVSHQENILAPQQYEKFAEALNEAGEKNAKQRDASEEVAEAKKAAAQIEEKSKASRALLAEVLVARQKAMDAGALGMPKFKDTDKDLAKITHKATTGDIKEVQSESKEFQNRYLNAEGDAIVAKTIGSLQGRFEELKEKNAEKYAPKTFERTKAKLELADRDIRANRTDAQILAQSQENAQLEVTRLEKISSDAQRLKNEPAAIEMFDKAVAARTEKKIIQGQNAALENEKSQLEDKLSSSQTKNINANAKLSSTQNALATEQEKSQENAAFEQKFTDARKAFDPNEAEVYKDGANLLIRLKGLSFEKGNGTLPPASAAILKKLGTVVAAFEKANVRIEGHTDSTGTAEINARISKERAETVRNYLVSNNIAKSDEVVAQGMGEAGPVASNKSPSGRAQNRRVDVIVQPIM